MSVLQEPVSQGRVDPGASPTWLMRAVVILSPCHPRLHPMWGHPDVSCRQDLSCGQGQGTQMCPGSLMLCPQLWALTRAPFRAGEAMLSCQEGAQEEAMVCLGAQGNPQLHDASACPPPPRSHEPVTFALSGCPSAPGVEKGVHS